MVSKGRCEGADVYKPFALGVTCALLTAITAADAADLPLKAPPAPVIAPFSWTGFYIGGNAGGSWRDFDLVLDDPLVHIQQVTNVIVAGRGLVVVPGTSRDLGTLSGKTSGFAGGGQIGYNWQWNRFVFGVEGDIQATTGKASATFSTILPFTAVSPPSPVTVTRTFETDWMASLRLRAGFTPVDRVLLYGTGGVAFVGARVTSTDNITVPPGPGAPPQNSDVGAGGALSLTATASDKQTHVGWTLGGGADWAVSDNIVIGILYRHSDFRSKTYNIGTNTPFLTIGQILPGCLNNCTSAGPGLATSNGTVRFTDDQLTVRASWRFAGR
jgi:outer membrane immunogenic protein